jgi:hypothetical protein
LPTRSADLQARDLERASARNYTLGRCRRQSQTYQLSHLFDREPVRQHDGLSAAVPAGGEQLERAAAALTSILQYQPTKLADVPVPPS